MTAIIFEAWFQAPFLFFGVLSIPAAMTSPHDRCIVMDDGRDHAADHTDAVHVPVKEDVIGQIAQGSGWQGSGSCPLS